MNVYFICLYNLYPAYTTINPRKRTHGFVSKKIVLCLSTTSIVFKTSANLHFNTNSSWWLLKTITYCLFNFPVERCDYKNGPILVTPLLFTG